MQFSPQLQIVASRHLVGPMPLVENSLDRQFVNVYLNILATPVKDANPSAFSTLIALPLRCASTKNVAILAQDCAAITQSVESSTILLLVTVLKATLTVHSDPARSFQLKVESQIVHPSPTI